MKSCGFQGLQIRIYSRLGHFPASLRWKAPVQASLSASIFQKELWGGVRHSLDLLIFDEILDRLLVHRGGHDE